MEPHDGTLPETQSLVVPDQLKSDSYTTGYGNLLSSPLVTHASTAVGNEDLKKGDGPEFLVLHASKGYSIDYNINAPTPTSLQKPLRVTTKITPPLRDLLNLVQQDPVALAAINKIVDKVMGNGWYVRGRDLKSKDKAAMQALKDLRFNKVMQQLLFHIVLYKNAFLELVRDGNSGAELDASNPGAPISTGVPPKGKVTELNTLEPTLMRISATNFGEVIGYWQNVILPDRKGNPGFSMEGYPVWEPDEIIHFKKSRLTTRAWGDVDLTALETNLKTKLAIKRFVYWLFETNQFRGFFRFPNNAHEDQVKEFLTYYRLVQGDLTKPITVRSDEVDYELLRDFKDAPNIIAYLDKLDGETLELLGVPPMKIGRDTGGANRSTGDSTDDTFDTGIASLQDFFSDILTYELLPAIGYKKVDFVFEPLGKKDVSSLMTTAQIMVSMQMRPEVVEAWLKSEGFDPGTDNQSLFVSPEEQQQQAQGMAQATMKPKDMMTQDQAPSRKGTKPGEGNKRIGTGSQGTTRKDQLVTHANDIRERWVYDAIIEE